MNRSNLRDVASTLSKFLGVLFLATYVCSYAYFSRRGMREARQYNSEGILYAPVREVAQSHDLSRHHLLRVLFMPLNLIDQKVFGADEPVICMMFELS